MASLSLETGCQDSRSQHEAEHSCFSDNTVADIVGNAIGVRMVLTSDYGVVYGPGIIDLIAADNEALAGRLADETRVAVSMAHNILDPFDQHLTDAAPDSAFGRSQVLSTIKALEKYADTIVEGAAPFGYAGYFKGAAGVALVEQQAIDEVVRTSVFMTRSIADMRSSKALGADDGQPDPSAIHGAGGNNAVTDLRNQVLDMQDTYLGPELTELWASARWFAACPKKQINGCASTLPPLWKQSTVCRNPCKPRSYQSLSRRALPTGGCRSCSAS